MERTGRRDQKEKEKKRNKYKSKKQAGYQHKKNRESEMAGKDPDDILVDHPRQLK